MASENEKPPKQFAPGPEESVHDSQNDKIFAREFLLLADSTIEQIPEFIDLVQELKTALTNPETDPQRLKQLWVDYSKLFEVQADHPDNKDMRAKIQVLAILYKALIFKDVNNTLRYLEELDKTHIAASEFRFDDLRDNVDDAIEAGIVPLRGTLQELAPEILIIRLGYILDGFDREDLWDIWLKEQLIGPLVDCAYEMLVKAGENPEEILRSLGVDEHYWASQ